MSALDIMVAEFPHGTPEGYNRGCRGAACVHDGVGKMRCTDAAQRYRGDWAYRKAVDAGTPPLEPESFARPARAVAAPKTAAPKAARKPAAVKPPREKKQAAPRKERVPKVTAPKAVKPLRAPKPASMPKESKKAGPRGPKPITHSTVYGYMRGCKRDEDCPNRNTPEGSCSQVRRDYYAGYRERMRQREIPAEVHGTPYGYQMGCRQRSTCPGNDEHPSCADASLAEERRRRRAAGVPEQRLVDSSAVREHLDRLRRNGMTLLAIAEAAGVGKTAVMTLIHGRYEYVDGSKGPRHGEIPARIDADKAERFLAVMPPRIDSSPTPEGNTP